MRSHATELFIFVYYITTAYVRRNFTNRWLIRDTFFLVTDGDKDKEDIRRWIIGTDDAGGREKLLRAVRPGEYTYQMILINDGARKSRPYTATRLTVTNIRHRNRISPTVCCVSELARSRNHRACCLLVTVQVDNLPVIIVARLYESLLFSVFGIRVSDIERYSIDTIQRFAYFTSLIRPKRKIWRGYMVGNGWKACISRSIRIAFYCFSVSMRSHLALLLRYHNDVSFNSCVSSIK